MFAMTRSAIIIIAINIIQLQTQFCEAFSSSWSSFVARTSRFGVNHSSLRNDASLQMRDTSASYWFSIGDMVRVVDVVMKSGTNLQGRVGVVQETWEKCDVDPTCCCAEQVDKNMAVRVRFGEGNNEGSFSHYFPEEELERVVTETTKSPEETPMPFDGMSCKAFKLEQLDLESRPRRIASYDPNQSHD